MGGHVELHETPWAAVAHEIREESGYDLDQLRLLQPPHTITDFGDRSVAHPLPFVFGTHPFGADDTHYHTDTAFVFLTDEEPRYQPGEDESATLRLFTRDEIENLPPEQIPHNLRVSALYIFDSLLGKWREVDPLTYSTASLGKPKPEAA